MGSFPTALGALTLVKSGRLTLDGDVNGILSGSQRLTAAGKLWLAALAVAVVAGPVLVGILNASQSRAHLQG